MWLLRWFVALFMLGTAWVMLGIPGIGMVLATRAMPAITLPTLTPEQETSLTSTTGRVTLGKCYRERLGAITHVHLEGAPAELGFYQGALVGDSIARIETEMMGVFTERVPNFWARHLLLGLVNWNNRALDSYFRPEELIEIAAITEGHRRYHDPFAAVSPSYTRGLQYHALHDISQYLIDNPLVHPPQVGCTAVATMGSRSQDGHVLVGRLFDFEGGSCFDRDKVVYTVRVDGGIPFVSVAWGGMAGAVTGLNDAGLWVSINAAATDGQAFVGRPIVMTVRRILERCHTIDEALAEVRDNPVFVSNGVLLASGVENRVVVAEVGPHGFGVRPMEHDALVLTNHFLSEVWKGDKANAGRIEHGTTTKRMRRAETLLARQEQHTPESLLNLLRDRRGVEDADVGFGNRGTINAWIGAHLVVADVTRKVLWVGEPWHGLGRAVAFGIDGPANNAALPASPDLAQYDRDRGEYVRLERQVNELLSAKKLAEALPLAERLVALNPYYFNAHLLQARATSDP
ncbi:MAG TPA: C45 family peptidase, partial [Planctomycetota bacterium]|nr:C45 family peptidase [Planctomycetota bacterium]